MGSPRTISIRRRWATTVVGLVATAVVGAGAATASMAPASAAPRVAAKKPPPTSSTTTTKPPTTTSTSATTSTTTTTTTTSPPASSITSTTTPAGCATGTATLGGASYCVGYIFAVLRTAYGVGSRVVLQGVWVSEVNGSMVTLNGGPSCFPGEWCGQLVPSMQVALPAGSPSVAVGAVVDVYGVTVTGGLSTDAVVVLGSCAEFGC